MIDALKTRSIEKRSDHVTLSGRVLVLTDDADAVRRQLNGEDIEWPSDLTLRDDISTDEILPAGSRVLPFRSNIPAISRFSFENVAPQYVKMAEESKLNITLTKN